MNGNSLDWSNRTARSHAIVTNWLGNDKPGAPINTDKHTYKHTYKQTGT